MDAKEKFELTVTGSNAPVVIDAGWPTKMSQHIRPTPPQGFRALHSARSTKFADKSIHNEMELPSTQLSFSANSSARPDQHFPISVVLEANLPTMPPRKQSVVFSPRKVVARSSQITPRLLTSRSNVEKSLSDEDWSKSAIAKSYPNNMMNQSFFHVDAISATISPRPPVARTRSPSSIHSKPQSPRIARQIVEHGHHHPADCVGQIDALKSSHSLGSALHTEIEERVLMKRLKNHEIGSLETSDSKEDMQTLHTSFSYENASMMTKSSPQILKDGDISHAKRVDNLENRVQNSMNQSQYNKDMYQSIITNATLGINSTLKFAFPHPSPAQLFIVTQPIIKLSETTIMPQKLKPKAPVSRSSHPLPGQNSDDLAASKDNSRAFKIQSTSPRQKNIFVVQKDAFVLKNISKSLQISLPSREAQQPILFNRIGPYKQQSSVHEIRAADAAIATLTATKPMQKNIAEHQKHHIMCNNRVPDFFLAAMHRNLGYSHPITRSVTKWLQMNLRAPRMYDEAYTKTAAQQKE